MTPHETALVTMLLERLKKIESTPNDPEAETLIRESTARKRCPRPGDLHRCMHHSHWWVGWGEFSARRCIRISSTLPS